MARVVIGILLNALIIVGVARVTPGVRIKGYGSAVLAAAVYALLTWGLKWLLVSLTFPLVILTFGLFLMVLNGFLLWITDKLVDGIEIEGWRPLVIATIGITLGGLVVHAFV